MPQIVSFFVLRERIKDIKAELNADEKDKWWCNSDLAQFGSLPGTSKDNFVCDTSGHVLQNCVLKTGIAL